MVWRMNNEKFPTGYKKIPALLQIALVFERLAQLRWEWIFGNAAG